MSEVESKQELIDSSVQELRKEYPFLSEGDSLLFIQDLYEFLEEYFF